ncbi:MAG: hypothetical protein ACI9WT_000081 [Flavobacterium sp.]|jgi:hypothetical protein
MSPLQDDNIQVFAYLKNSKNKQTAVCYVVKYYYVKGCHDNGIFFKE